ncbi:MAG: sulfatase [Acidobacteriota bacterium]
MKKTTVSLVVFMLIGSCSMVSGTKSRSQQKPNVLLIMMDDLNTDLGCYGSPVVKTPNIDRLAARGIRFDRAYCQFPLCNPSRTSLLTGLRPETTGVMGNFTDPRRHLGNRLFMPEYFRQQGYFTARVGKITHNLFAQSVSWDVSEGAEDVGGIDNSKQCKGRTFCKTENRDEDEIEGRVARRVAELLDENRNKAFFIAAGFGLPHSPWYAPRKYFDLYPVESIPVPEGAGGHNNKRIRQWRAAYYACVSFVDAQIKIILDQVDRLGLADNTVIVFLSDHGFLLGEHGGIFDKKKLFEEAARVPLIVSSPGGPRGAASSRIVETVDLYPSLIELCGLSEIEDLEGISFVPLFANPEREWKKAAFASTKGSHRQRFRCARTERYVYIERADGIESELYDHETDPRELVNVVRDPRYAAVLTEMKKILSEGWRKALPPPP